jgi:hypothetical protein
MFTEFLILQFRLGGQPPLGARLKPSVALSIISRNILFFLHYSVEAQRSARRCFASTVQTDQTLTKKSQCADVTTALYATQTRHREAWLWLTTNCSFLLSVVTYLHTAKCSAWNGALEK